MNNRHKQILEILTSRGKIDVLSLSKLLDVSQVTIRKDLNYLEECGIVKREHGYALLSSNNDIATRLAYHYDIKQKIATYAASLVKENETIMVESGSCCALLAKELALSKKHITIITNSVFISDYIRKSATFEIILLGGNYQKDSQAIVGPLVNDCVKNFWVNKFFIGIDGYASNVGFTNKDQYRAQAVKDMARQADNIIVLTESEKFNSHSNIPMNITDKVKCIITDSKIKENAKSDFLNKNIKLITI